MSAGHRILGFAGLLLLASLAPRGRRPEPASTAHDPKPKQLRKPSFTPKPDAAVAKTNPVSVWVLCQVLPTFHVLMVSADQARLRFEMNELAEMHNEARGQQLFSWQIRIADHLFPLPNAPV